MQKSRNLSFDESKFYFEKKIESDEEEKVGDEVFFGEKFLRIYNKMLRKLYQTVTGKNQ